MLYGFFLLDPVSFFYKKDFDTSFIFHILTPSKISFNKPLIPMTYKRKLTELKSSIQTLIKASAKTKQDNQQLKDLEAFLPLLGKAIQTEEKALAIETDELIKNGYQTKVTADATIDPKYKDIKELQQYLYEDNIRDTNPILILSFNKLIGLTIDYLQNLEGMLKVISANSHEDDKIGGSIKNAILDLFTGNDVNSYELNQHIRTVLGEIIDDIFAGQGSISLVDFSHGLAYEIRHRLIQPFQTTSKKQLKKNFGKKFRKHKKSPYPSVSKVIRAIDLNDIPFDVQGKVNQEKQLSNLLSWCDSFRQQLDKLEEEYKTDFLNDVTLQAELKAYKSSLADEVTPASCKLHLVDNILNQLGKKSVLNVIDLSSMVRKELEALRIKIKASISSGEFKSSDNDDFFLGIRPESYVSFIRKTVEENRFDEYTKIIKDWVVSLDKLMNKLGIDEERGKYNYKSRVISLNLSKLFKIEHDLIDFSSFIQPIIKGIKAKDFSLELSEVDALFSNSIADGNIYTKLIGLYNAAIEKGSFDSSLNTLETTLPTMSQIGHAILSAKIDLILNREVQFLTLQWNLIWRNRDNILQNLLAFLESQTSVGTTIINTLENLVSGGGRVLPSRVTLDIPIKLSLGLDSNNKYFAYGVVDKEASENDIYSINNETPYSLDCIDTYNTITSDTSSSKNRQVESVLNLKLNFENPGVDVGIDISAFVISTGGSAIVQRRTQSLAIEFGLTSNFNGNDVTINLSNLPIFDGAELIENDGELANQPIYRGRTTSLTFKAFN